MTGRRGGGARRRFLAPGEPAVAIVAAVVVSIAVWRGAGPELFVAVGVAVAGVRRAAFAVVLVTCCAVGVVRADREDAGLQPDRLGPFAGWATVALDPAPAHGATRVVLQIEGERFEAWERGRAARLRVGEWNQGDVVWAVGERVPLDGDRAGRVAWQHVVGGFDREYYGDRVPGRPLAVAANRVRRLVADGTGVLPAPRAALARGLIIGDDRDQPPDMVERFRVSGLSHLTAVSGQNVAFVVAAAGPLLRRLRPGPRLFATVALIGWFVVLTRAEPSILRAGTMAGVGAVAFATGREREPPRLLAISVIGLLLVDPLLVRSIGFWLSVGATAGVTMLAPTLVRVLKPLGRLALPLGVTLGAQIGVAVPSLLVFGRLSAVGTVANLAAVPVAGAVMLYGLPASLLAGAAGLTAPALMIPVDLGVRWVDGVARVAARLDPPPTLNAAGWILVVGVVARCTRRTAERPGAGRERDDPLSQ
ncbi:ComEC/Rec2 family competence protein [Desertimonas flava]|uniref:ComEC/Rec2 family competence protein n=1 Tax=Desertimonas flava TaxID=2064846 RepID=UPI0013C40E0C|nr:ComEC/Rec2 family competence protein [Desertimonas flava]